MNDQIKVSLEKAQYIIDSMHHTTDHVTKFSLIYEYVIAIFTNSHLKPYLKTIFQEGQQKQAKLEPYKIKALQELQQKAQVMTEFTNKYYIDDSKVIEYIQQFYILLEKHNQQFHEELFLPLEYALHYLLNSEKNKIDITIIEKLFGTIIQVGYDKSILQKIAFPQFFAWRNAQLAFDDTKVMTPWFSLHQLISFLHLRDFQIHDNICNELKQKHINSIDFEDKSRALFKYINSNNQKSTQLFPTAEQYQSYMRILLGAVHAMIITQSLIHFTYQYFDDDETRHGILKNNATGDLHRYEGNASELLYTMINFRLQGKHKIYWNTLGGEFASKSTIDHARRNTNENFIQTFKTSIELLSSTKGFLTLNNDLIIKLIH